jgi:hypothetical protein
MTVCSVAVHRHFEGMSCLHLQGRRVSRQPVENKKNAGRSLGLLFDPEVGGSMFFRSVCELLHDVTSQKIAHL